MFEYMQNINAVVVNIKS